MSPRLLLSFYASAFLHLSMILIGIGIFIGAHDRLVCGYVQSDTGEEIELTISKDTNPENLTLESTKEAETQLDEKGKEADSKSTEKTKSETPSDQKLSSSNPNFDESKFDQQKWGQLIKELKDTKSLRKDFKESFNDISRGGNAPDSYIKRNREYEDIIVKEVFPTVREIDKKFSDLISKSEKSLEDYLERNEIINEFWDPDAEEKRLLLEKDISLLDKDNIKKPLLKMSELERSEYFDKTIKQSKEDQLQNFANKYLTQYDPNDGDLPLMLRELYYKNLQRIAYSISPDGTYFTIDYFQENLNKEDFLFHVMKYLSDFKDTKTGVEILFTLENIYEIQERALNQYFSNLDTYNRASPQNRKEIRYETIRRVIEKYKPFVNEKNLKNYTDVVKMYSKRRIEIMDYLLETTPKQYRVADALFEKARIHWELGQKTQSPKDMETAIELWKSISKLDTNQGDFFYKDTYSEMKKLLDSFNKQDFSKNAQLTNQITNLLNLRLRDYLDQKQARERRLLWNR